MAYEFAAPATKLERDLRAGGTAHNFGVAGRYGQYRPEFLYEFSWPEGPNTQEVANGAGQWQLHN